MSLHLRVATSYIISAVSPLPPMSKTEVGLMTMREYLTHQNPDGKYHPSDSYDIDVESFNRTLYGVANTRHNGDDWTLLQTSRGNNGKYILVREGVPVAALIKDTLFHTGRVSEHEIPLFFSIPGREYDLRPKQTKRIKYLDEIVAMVSGVAAKNLAEYPHVIQRIIVQGEPLQIRASAKPEKNAGTTLVILNDKMEIVAMASDEWGATLLRVAQEYRRRGLGQILGKLWYDLNPSYSSGGYTQAGRENAIRLWEARVREFLENGWYSELLREGRITSARVKEILKDLRGRPKIQEKKEVKKGKGDLLVYAQPPTFVVYNSNFLEDPDDKYIHGYGFFRDASVGTVLYTIDYDRPFQKLVTSVALQMARDEHENIYVGPQYGDIFEWEDFPGVVQQGQYVSLERDVLPLRALGKKEERERRKADPYHEKEALLLEMAESKWS